MSAIDAIKTYVAAILPDWRIQQGRWTDDVKTDRYAVIRPITGGPVASLVRRPMFTLLLIGGSGDSISVPSIAADAVIESMRSDNGTLVSMRATEAAYSATDDGRHTFEFSIHTITN